MTWRERFGMHTAPLPRGAAGESFFERDPHYQRLARAFCWLATEPGLGVLTGEPGVGKSAAIRHLCRALHPDEHRVLYLSDCAVKPLDLYRMLAAELGLRPSARAQIVADIKRALVTLVDERGIVPVVVLDEAQGLRDELLHELHGLCSLDFDGRDYLTLWLVGHPSPEQAPAPPAAHRARPARPRPPPTRRQDRPICPWRHARSRPHPRRRLTRSAHRRRPRRAPPRRPRPPPAPQPPPPPRPPPRRRARLPPDRRLDHQLRSHPPPPRSPQATPNPS
ncbi:MAG: ATP-binding protein [Nannocystis sp.]|nr:ATP-binding protein [Nannocystis sp.]